MLDKIKPGSTITVTVTKTPRAKGDIDTLRRLARMNTANQRTLARMKNLRANITVHRPRAGRIWIQRPTVSKLILGKAGETWQMRYRPQYAADLSKVSKFISIKAA